MIKYAVVEISGRQYLAQPNRDFLVNYLGDQKKIECDKVLLLSEEGKLKIGKPYLKEKLTFVVLGKLKGEKIRVATYHAKANTRRVKGQTPIYTKIKLHSSA